MTGRERALAVFRYQETDRPCFDLMEGTTWHELGCYFNLNYGLFYIHPANLDNYCVGCLEVLSREG